MEIGKLVDLYVNKGYELPDAIAKNKIKMLLY
mgnify:CR=1 FL=1